MWDHACTCVDARTEGVARPGKLQLEYACSISVCMHLGPLTYIHTLACPYTHVLVGQNAGETGSGACCDLRLATIIMSYHIHPTQERDGR
jgi:hypothetical protein